MQTRNSQRGMTLVELMIASVIGLIALGAAGAVYLSGKTVYTSAEMLGRMQETARIAALYLEDDLKHAGLYGLTASFANITGTTTTPPALPAAAGDCDGGQWYLALNVPLEAYNDSNPFAATCLSGVNYANTTDIMAVRRTLTNVRAASTDPIAPNYADIAGQVLLRSTVDRGVLFVAPTPPAGMVNWSDFIYTTRVYYLSAAGGVFALNVQDLSNSGANPVFTTREIVRGVEDMQFELGIDADGDGSPERFVPPPTSRDIALFNSTIAVRYWLLIRADRLESDLPSQKFTYAGKVVEPTDNFRRLLTSGTVFLRNTR